MNTPGFPSNPQILRERYIRQLDSSDNPTQTARELAEDLFSLDLTVYSSDFSFDSLLYSAMAKSIEIAIPAPISTTFVIRIISVNIA